MLISLKSAANEIGVTNSTLHKWRYKGLKVVKQGREYCTTLQWVAEFKETHKKVRVLSSQDDSDLMSFRDIAIELGLSTERVRQIYTRAIEKLKAEEWTGF